MAFAGFPRGVLSTPVPDPLLNTLLAEIEDLAELKVTLRGLWLAHQKKGTLRAVSREEFLNDKVLLRGLQGVGSSPREAIEEGLDRAVRRRTLLVYRPDPARPQYRLYALNTEGHRRALQQARAGVAVPHAGDGAGEATIAPPTEDKPNIFALYENNIGTISPLLAEQLKEAEDLYPGSWISDAFQISVTQNKRSWAYISTILRRWLEEGKDLGESGGHPKADNRTEYLKEYQRRRGHLPWESADR